MNFCKYCGKEISDKKKFCNSSCAAKYNNVHRVRKPWTEEQRQEVRKPRVEQVCKYCGKPTGRLVFPGRQKTGTCGECSAYVKVNLYEKLGLLEGSLKDRYFKAQEIFKSYYFIDQMSLPEIQEITGVDWGIIRGFLTLDGSKLRSKGEAEKVALIKGRRNLTGHDPKYRTGKHISWQNQEYFFRSSWEEDYMSLLDDRKIRYIYEPFRLWYFDSNLQVNRVAIPDFYLPETNEIVEIKSSWTYAGQEQCMKDKFKAYREAGYVPKLILDWKIVDNLGS